MDDIAKILQKYYDKNNKIRAKQFEVPTYRRDVHWSLEAQHTLGRLLAIKDIAKELGVDLEC